jgi:tripartite-type tricarboxylate transporter receptor subunit TctC
MSGPKTHNYPTRQITMIVPFPAGGATDTLARFLAEKKRWWPIIRAANPKGE